jgi:ParB family chromosome partitioning protein
MESIDLSQIKVSNPYLRTKTDIELLKKSIQTVGLINPLTLNAENELIAGGRRYQALKELGFTQVDIVRVNKDQLEQELISIDENLVRTPLNKIELESCLNRGREIYEQLNPSANKIDTDIKELTPEQKRHEKEAEENDTTSFAAVTAEKTGLSKAVIKKAIQRDLKSSQRVKEARGAGELSASQVNEMIQLEEKDQDQLLEHVKNKSVKNVRRMIKTARSQGVEAAIEESEKTPETPRELIQLESLAKKINKLFSKVLLEDMPLDEKQNKKLIQIIGTLNQQAQEFLEKFEFSSDHIPASLQQRETDQAQEMVQ